MSKLTEFEKILLIVEFNCAIVFVGSIFYGDQEMLKTASFIFLGIIMIFIIYIIIKAVII